MIRALLFTTTMLAVPCLAYAQPTGGPGPLPPAPGACNVLRQGADPTGVADSTPAANACAALGKAIYFPAGSYRINGQINISAGQDLYGDGDHLSFLLMDQNLSSSANGVIAMTGVELSSPGVHDIAGIFTQPTNISTTAV